MSGGEKKHTHTHTKGVSETGDPHQVFYGELEGGDLFDDLVVPLHLVDTLGQILETQDGSADSNKVSMHSETHTYSHGIEGDAKVLLVLQVGGVLDQLLEGDVTE